MEHAPAVMPGEEHQGVKPPRDDDYDRTDYQADDRLDEWAIRSPSGQYLLSGLVVAACEARAVAPKASGARE